MNNVKANTPSHKATNNLRFVRRIGGNGSVQTILQQQWITTEFAKVHETAEWRDVPMFDETTVPVAKNLRVNP